MIIAGEKKVPETVVREVAVLLLGEHILGTDKKYPGAYLDRTSEDPLGKF